MGDYVVGSIADLISNKGQPKKRKYKLETTSLVSETNNENVKITRISKKKSKSNNPVSSDSPVKNLSTEKENLSKKNRKSKKNADQSALSPSKKRKISSKEFIPNPTDNEKDYEKQNKDLLSLDHVPSDSEEEGEDSGKNFNKKRKGSTQQTSPRDNVENTIFVGNIPLKYDKQKVCKVFSKFGEIQNARIRCVPVENINMSKKVAAIKKKFNPKRNSLVAYVKYKSQDSAYAALKANGMVIDGHHIRVDLAEQAKERDNNKAVFVGGLPFDIEDDELWEFFQNCGDISSVRIIRDSQTSAGKGFGYVNFVSTASVELALQLDGQQLKKRTINVKRCVNNRNKNKLNAFGKQKSKEITNQLLCKKGKKFKEEKKKIKKERKDFSGGFQGKMANVKQKKKKKLSKAALRQRKLVKILGAS